MNWSVASSSAAEVYSAQTCTYSISPPFFQRWAHGSKQIHAQYVAGLTVPIGKALFSLKTTFYAADHFGHFTQTRCQDHRASWTQQVFQMSSILSSCDWVYRGVRTRDLFLLSLFFPLLWMFLLSFPLVSVISAFRSLTPKISPFDVSKSWGLFSKRHHHLCQTGLVRNLLINLICMKIITLGALWWRRIHWVLI